VTREAKVALVVGALLIVWLVVSPWVITLLREPPDEPRLPHWVEVYGQDAGTEDAS
jgi:hypothetical protein